MTSGTISTALIFVWMLNIMMILSTLATDNMTAGLGVHVWNCSGSIVSEYSSSGNCAELAGPDTRNLTSMLPGSDARANPTTGFGFVDWIASAVNWVSDQVNTFSKVVSAPYTLLKTIPLFQQPEYASFATIIGTAWWGISFFLIVAFIFGR